MDTGLIIIFVGTICMVIGVKFWQKGSSLLRYGKKAKGIVFKNNWKTNGTGRVYYPVVRFLTDKQEWITQELSVGYSLEKAEGSEIEVVYDPEDPSNVAMNSTFQLVILPRLLVAAGITAIVAGTLVYLEIVTIVTK